MGSFGHAPLDAARCVTGRGPFVINLSSSYVPMSLPANGIAIAREARIYQICHREEQRLRYRLRVGPFMTEPQANAVLRVVRDKYPGALIALAGADDLARLADLQKAGAPEAAATPMPISSAPPTLAGPPMPAVSAATALENTQTLRPLTASELAPEQLLRWFVIELALSTCSFDPDAVPNLDIFSAYRLYAVEAIDQGRTIHALRLGFFSEASAAQAVADYVKNQYAAPLVKRVSVAERERFMKRRLEARKMVDTTGQHAVIEITDERFVRQRRPGI